MAARILNFILGLLLVAVGWAIAEPAGQAGQHLPPMALGLLEGHRPFIGWGAVALGFVALLSAVLPRGGGPKGGRKGPPVANFEAEPEPSHTDAHPAEGAHASHTSHATALIEEEPAPFPAAVSVMAPAAEPAPAPAPDPAPTPVASTGGAETFPDLRNRLRELVRAEAWTEAAALARRLSASATNDEERLAAAQDLGDFARTHGDSEDAAEAYDTALGYARHMMDAAPTDPGRMATLSGVLTGVGDVAQDEGRLEAALEAYEESVALCRKVAAVAPSAGARRALSLALERLADAREDRGHRVRALDLYRESFDIAADLASLDPQAYGEDLAVTRRRLSELEARLAG